MARNPNLNRQNEYPNYGKSVFASKAQGATWTVHFEPEPSAIELAANLDHNFTPPTGLLLLAKGDSKNDSLDIYPHNLTAPSHGLFGPKYPILRTIRFENIDMLSSRSMVDAQ